jgi:hypothetical protein
MNTGDRVPIAVGHGARDRGLGFDRRWQDRRRAAAAASARVQQRDRHGGDAAAQN